MILKLLYYTKRITYSTFRKKNRQKKKWHKVSKRYLTFEKQPEIFVIRLAALRNNFIIKTVFQALFR